MLRAPYNRGAVVRTRLSAQLRPNGRARDQFIMRSREGRDAARSHIVSDSTP